MQLSEQTTKELVANRKVEPRQTKYYWLRFIVFGLINPVFWYFLVFHWLFMLPPRIEQHLGPKLTWRSTYWYGLAARRYGKLQGHFNSNGDEELLLGRWDHPAVRMGVDGKRHRTGVRFSVSNDGFAAWDSNADGVDEFISSNNDMCYVEDVNGKELQHLPGGLLQSDNAVGRLKPGGLPELVLCDPPSSGSLVRCYAPNETQAQCFPQPQDLARLAVVDIDGDQICEVLGLVEERDQATAQTWLELGDARHHQPFTLPNPQNYGGFIPVHGVAVDSFIYKERSYYDLQRRKKVPLIFPERTDNKQWNPGTNRFHAASGDFLKLGHRQIAVAISEFTNSAFLLFDPSGKCLYYAEMNCEITGLACLHAQGRDYLVACATERVLIYP